MGWRANMAPSFWGCSSIGIIGMRGAGMVRDALFVVFGAPYILRLVLFVEWGW